MDIMDTLTLRCPDCMLKLRKAIDHFAHSDSDSMIIKTVEPSANRDINAYLNAVHGQMFVAETQQEPITEQEISAWIETKEHMGRRYQFNQDDIKGLTDIHYILIKKKLQS
ncbi:hypothetical protein QTV44_002503 [Vibrio vulnificus]|nr:hypothetical protein [Vibrio vulnificus]